MLQLICHLIGDYVLQNDKMAMNKHAFTVKGWFWCFTHCLIYTIPFLFITRDPLKLFLIFLTHFIIDKFNLGRKWTENLKIINFDPSIWLHTYLVFMVDMTFHLICNYSILTYL